MMALKETGKPVYVFQLTGHMLFFLSAADHWFTKARNADHAYFVVNEAEGRLELLIEDELAEKCTPAIG
jgi:hypothetical protein